jgi:FtsP/CotA-like multicopper oxidase with cupredoxin domain
VNVQLKLQYADHEIARVVEEGRVLEADKVRLRSYNGKLVGPVIEARPGDTLNVFLDNELPPEPDMGGEHNPNIPHGFNTTNLHFHGMHVSPVGNADNVLLALGPGQRFQFEVKIPSDHPAGTYWYHPHRHGSTAIQLGSGLAGALIIRGDIDELPPIREAEERIFILQQIPYVLDAQGIGRVETYENFGPGKWPTLGRRFTVNGEAEPTLGMRPGEVQRWRFIHAGIREGLQLKLVRRDASGAEESLSQYQIAHDGITTGHLDEVKETVLHPGYRVDVLVRAADGEGRPLPEGVYWLVGDFADGSRPATGRNLARIVVKGRRVRMRLPTERELAPLAPFKPITEDEITGTQEAVFDIDIQSTPPRFLINGRPFDPSAPPRQLRLGAVEKWRVSSTPLTGHPFHIHVNPFQLSEGGRILWKDTLFVPAGQTVELLTRYERYIGTFAMHCHIIDHEDRG